MSKRVSIYYVDRMKLLKVGKPIMAPSSRTSRVSHTMGLPLCFLPARNTQAVPRSIDIDIGWPTSLVGGERPGGSEFGCVGT